MPRKRTKPPQRSRARPSSDPALREQIVDLLRKGHAHMEFDDVVRDWPPALRGEKPPGQPFTPWRLLEHIRITQWDIVEFTRSAEHVSPDWPESYWPKEDSPPDEEAWDKSVAQVRRDRRTMERIVADPKTDLFSRIPHGTGQTVLREALVLADHNAYHLGQLLLLRRLVGAYGDAAK
jgi:hypothetical protein